MRGTSSIAANVALAVLVLLGLLCLGSLALRPANAQTLYCNTYAGMKAALLSKYRETGRGKGISAGSILIELFTSKSGTYTIITIEPNNRACIIAAGQDWIWSPADSGTSL